MENRLLLPAIAWSSPLNTEYVNENGIYLRKHHLEGDRFGGDIINQYY